jgi:hypothetical protein
MTCVVCPKARASRIRIWPKFFSLESVEGVSKWSAGEDGEAGILRVVARKDSRQAIRGVAVVTEGAEVFISLSTWILGIDRCDDGRLLGFAVWTAEDSQGWIGKSIEVNRVMFLTAAEG